MSRRDDFVQIAKTVPIEPISGVTADEVQTALEQIYTLAKNASRGAIECGFDGGAGVGRWLEFHSNNPSNTGPFIVAEPGIIRAISVSCSSNSTSTITVFKNAVSVATLSLAAAQSARNKTLNISVTDLDKISVQVTSGSISKPTFFISIQTL